MHEKKTLGAAVLTICLLALLTARPLEAGSVKVAVASNFKPTLVEVAEVFENFSGHTVVPIVASTGTLYAQISQGAQFDVFLAANVDHPRQLEIDGLAVAGSRFTYATGVLVLWRPGAESLTDGRQVLASAEFRFLAIANPDLAPYGRAAQEVMQQMGLWETLQPRVVRGQNVGQAFAFVASGNAELGFVALSQVSAQAHVADGDTWIVPRHLYAPIEQQAVLLNDNEGGRRFMSFLAGKRAGDVIRRHGYSRD